MKTWQSVLLGIFLGMIFTGVVFIVAKQPTGEPIQLLPSATPSPVKVYITGAILHPGVYSLPTSSRVQDLVDQAGGFLDDADPGAVNLAAVIADEQKIVVPYIKLLESQVITQNGTASPTQVSYPININTATKEDLDVLPGIGASKAEEIVKYRNQKGQFNTIEDIQNVPGIGPGIFLKIKELIMVK
jgi:competence protein ComEA